MAFRRGSGTVNVELARLQSWVEQADPDLYGDDRTKGVIKEHEEIMMREATEKDQHSKSTQRTVMLCAVFGAITPLCNLIAYLHSVWK